MTTKIACSVSLRSKCPSLSGAVPAGYMVWLTESNATVAMENISPGRAVHHQFAPGVYTAHVVRMDPRRRRQAGGDSFIVAEDMVNVPFIVTVNVADAVAIPKAVKARVR